MATPPDFVAGQVLTAAQMNGIGLWEIKSQTIGTAVSSVVVTGAFSADYENYLIVVNGGVASTTLNLNLTLGSANTAYYQKSLFGTWANNTITGVGVNNAANFPAIVRGTTSSLSGTFQLLSPNLAKNTIMFFSNTETSTTTGFWEQGGGMLADTTQHTAFTLTASTGTITGGTIRVYGYRN